MTTPAGSAEAAVTTGEPAWSPVLAGQLTGVSEVLAVVAHPDDESFGLGGVLAALASAGRRVRVLCLTHGEASTLGDAGDLAGVRASELACAARQLGVVDASLEEWPDGKLADADRAAVTGRIAAQAASADAIVVLEPSGVTGHPDHQAASRLALAVAAELGLATIEWGVPEAVAVSLREEFGVNVGGLPDGDGVVTVPVDRARQWKAIGCHVSQQPDNPLLARRLQLTGPHEWIRLRPASFERRLARFVGRVGPLVAAGAGPAERRQVLDRLVGLAAGGLPPELIPDPPAGTYGVTCLHDDPKGWTLAAVRTDAWSCTPPHDHTSWGAAATALGVERNRRYTGSCPDRLELLDEQLDPVGGGYLFAERDIHQACDATGTATVSLHLLAAGGPMAQQRCHEPAPRTSTTSD